MKTKNKRSLISCIYQKVSIEQIILLTSLIDLTLNMNNSNELHDIFTKEDEAFKFICNSGLLYDNGICDDCGGIFYAYKDDSTYSGFILKCSTCHKKKSIFFKSIFTKSKIPLCKILHIIYCWSLQYSRNQAEHETGCSPDTITNYYQACRQACHQWQMSEQPKIGGPGLTVEIDESQMTKRKNNVGRITNEQWIFGGICRETRERFVVPVHDRTAETLLPLIETYIANGSNINSDSWKSYSKIHELDSDYNHNIVNHHRNFVDPQTGTHTQTIERMWREVKRVKRRSEGIRNSDVDFHISRIFMEISF